MQYYPCGWCEKNGDSRRIKQVDERVITWFDDQDLHHTLCMTHTTRHTICPRCYKTEMDEIANIQFVGEEK